MPSLGLGIGIPFIRPTSGGGIDSQAQAHYDRVIADGGVVPSGLIGVNSFFTTVKAIYGTTDITTAISTGYDPQYLGYKLGAGSGTTLGQAARTLYSCSGASGDVTQTTAASQPLLLAHEGANYYFQSGIDANYCSTPHSTANNISGDIEIIAYIINYRNIGASLYTIAGKGDALSYVFDIGSTNFLEFYTGGSPYNSGVSIGSTFTGWVRVTRVSSTGVIKFFTSANAQNTNPLSVSWTQLGSDAISPSGSLATNTNPLTIAGYTTSGLYGLSASIYRCVISNSIGGTPVVDFNPQSYNAATSQTQWTSATGEVWTINTGTATTGYKGVLVDRTTIMGDYIDDNMSSTISRSSINTTFIAAKGFTNDNTGGAIVARPSSGFSNIVIFGATGTFVWMNTFASNVNVSRVVNALEMYTITNNSGVNNAISKNNGTENTNTYTPNNMGSGLTLMGANLCLNTYVENSSESTTIQKTAMYNAIKGFNNNAF